MMLLVSCTCGTALWRTSLKSHEPMVNPSTCCTARSIASGGPVVEALMPGLEAE